MKAGEGMGAEEKQWVHEKEGTQEKWMQEKTLGQKKE